MLMLGAGLVAGVIDMCALLLGWHEIRFVTKPLPAICFGVAALRRPAWRMRVFAGGLFLAATGDELLLQPSAVAFEAGMAAFALMHIAYITAFTHRLFQRLGYGIETAIGLAYFTLWFFLFERTLLPYVGDLAVPIQIYGVLLIVMALSTLQFPKRIGWARAWPIVVGAALFVASDLTLAFAKFTPFIGRTPVLTESIVMATYIAAQFLITLGFIES